MLQVGGPGIFSGPSGRISLCLLPWEGSHGRRLPGQQTHGQCSTKEALKVWGPGGNQTVAGNAFEGGRWNTLRDPKRFPTRQLGIPGLFCPESLLC